MVLVRFTRFGFWVAFWNRLVDGSCRIGLRNGGDRGTFLDRLLPHDSGGSVLVVEDKSNKSLYVRFKQALCGLVLAFLLSRCHYDLVRLHDLAQLFSP